MASCYVQTQLAVLDKGCKFHLHMKFNVDLFCFWLFEFFFEGGIGLLCVVWPVLEVSL